MTKAVVYALLTTVFVLFIIFSPSKQQSHDHLGLSRRLGYKLPLPVFDPLVTKMERSKEERESLNRSSSPVNFEGDNTLGSQVGDAHNYFSDDGKLNITLRLMILFPMLDNAPRDGVINLKELQAWNIQEALNGLRYRTQKELELRDRDGDGAISFNEYLPQFSDEDIEKNGMGHGEAGWWKEQFINADADRNGTLSFNEFKDFLHPEDSNNEEIQKWLLREKLKRMDDDVNGKLNFVEFRKHAYDIYKNYVEFESAGVNAPQPEEIFAQLDVNKDKVLMVEELIPIVHYLYPGEQTYAKYYSSYLIHEADDNGDGKLTPEEMLNHEYIFYSAVYGESHDDDDYLHEEL